MPLNSEQRAKLASVTQERLRASSSSTRFHEFVAEELDAHHERNVRVAAGKRNGVYRRKYIELLRPQWRLILGVLILTVAGISIDVTWPLLAREMIDGAVMRPLLDPAIKHNKLTVLGVFTSTLLIINAGIYMWRARATTLLNVKLALDLRRKIFHRLLYLPLSELHKLKAGSVVTRLSTDVDSTTSLIQLAFLTPSLALLRLLVSLSVMFSLNWRVAIAALVATPPLVFVHHRWIRRIRPIWRSIHQDHSLFDGRNSELFNGIRVVRAFGRESREELEHSISQNTIGRKQLWAMRLQSRINLYWELMMTAPGLILIWYGGVLIIEGRTTIGVIFALQAYILRLTEPIMSIITSLNDTQRSLSAMEQVIMLLDNPKEKPDPVGAIEAPNEVLSLVFRNVSFAYRSEHQVLRDINLTIPGGSVVAIVGPSGAGKTTFTDLVARFHDPSEGTLLLNGIDIRNIRLRSFRNLLGIVSQDVFLFDGTIRENIAYGRRGAKEPEILAAAQSANVLEFAQRLPEGLDTVVGELGAKLSGGQRQRLSIARAILADPAILVLDEATSNLDTESEQYIQTAIRKLLKNRTTFVVAHRLGTVVAADLIVVLEHGRVVETGSHPQLVERKGSYYSMIERQMRFVGDADYIMGWN